MAMNIEHLFDLVQYGKFDTVPILSMQVVIKSKALNSTG